MHLRALKAFTLLAAIIVITMVGGVQRALAQDPPPIEIIVNESIGVSDGSDATPPASVDVTEDITVSDDATVAGPVVIDVNESIVVSDDVSAGGPVDIFVSETIAVSDNPLAVGPVDIFVSETIFIEDTGGPVNAAPIVDAGRDLTVDEGDAVTLAASVIVLDPQLTTATIEWGDGDTDQVIPSTAGLIPATHLYAASGTYTITVTVSGLFGDQGVDTAEVEIVNLPPEADAGGPYSGNAGDTIVLTAIGSDPGGNPVTYAWDMNADGLFDQGNSQTVMFTSSTPGIFPVTVEVQDSTGASATGTAQVVVDAINLPVGADEPIVGDQPGDGPDLSTGISPDIGTPLVFPVFTAPSP